jgi:hypothetical protein
MIIDWHVQMTRQWLLAAGVMNTKTWDGVLPMPTEMTEYDRRMLADKKIGEHYEGVGQGWPHPESSVLLHYRCLPNVPNDINHVIGDPNIEVRNVQVPGDPWEDHSDPS